MQKYKPCGMAASEKLNNNAEWCTLAKTHSAGKAIPPLGEKPYRGKSNTPVTRKAIAREKPYPPLGEKP